MPPVTHSLTNSTKVHVLPECLRFVLWTKPASLAHPLPWLPMSACAPDLRKALEPESVAIVTVVGWLVSSSISIHFFLPQKAKLLKPLSVFLFCFLWGVRKEVCPKQNTALSYRLVCPCVQCLAILPEVSGLRHLRPRNFRLGMLNLCYLFALWYVGTHDWYMGHLQISALMYVMWTFY